MIEFNKMLDWKLLSGSHEFPGPDGGTCINEAAIIAAGFKYKKVDSWQDCPPCFSPLISQYAITLNDNLNDTERQKLIPFVAKIAGTKGSQELEDARAIWFVQQIVNDDLFSIAKKCNETELAELCFNAKTQQELKTAVEKFRSSLLSLSLSLSLSSLSSSLPLSLSSSLSSLLSLLSLSLLSLSLSSLSSLSSLLSLLSLSLSDRAIARLEGLVNFGRSEPEIEQSIAIERLQKARKRETV